MLTDKEIVFPFFRFSTFFHLIVQLKHSFDDWGVFPEVSCLGIIGRCLKHLNLQLYLEYLYKYIE